MQKNSGGTRLVYQIPPPWLERGFVVKISPICLILLFITPIRKFLCMPLKCRLNMTYLHKTSHNSPNIKGQKIVFYLKDVLFLVFCETIFFWQDSFKIFVFHIILLDFSSIFGFFESLFK